MRISTSLTLLLLIVQTLSLSAKLELASPFQDHMVLQREMFVPVWGQSDSGKEITVTIAGQVQSTLADSQGNWILKLDPMQAGGPLIMKITQAGETHTLKDVLVGEVWLCGGQSNMERQLGLRIGQKPIVGWQGEAASANYPQIRQYYVPQVIADTPQDSVNGTWTVCTPDTVIDFTAVGYFFGRDLHKELNVPIGLIHSSWGGTVAEAWMSRQALEAFGDFDEFAKLLKLNETNPDKVEKIYNASLRDWYANNDPGSASGLQLPDTVADDLPTMALPNAWESQGHEGFDGLFWFRKSFDLPKGWEGKDLVIYLSAIDDQETTWVNGKKIGEMAGWDTLRRYPIPAEILKATNNLIAIRVFDGGWDGGIWNTELPFKIVLAEDEEAGSISLAGDWFYKKSTPLEKLSPMPQSRWLSPNTPTFLFNSMINPLLPYAIKGAIFYQGESNAGRTTQYRTLLPALIQDWRSQFEQPELPFLFVQIAPYNGQPPEIREAQLIALKNTKNTAMAVTLDVGDAEDIHPANKGPVGQRLALAARAIAYGEAIEYSGPVYDTMQIREDNVYLNFKHTANGLIAPGGTLIGFTIAGADGVFHPAVAIIENNRIIVNSPKVPAPTAIRYAWANVAEGNLFNTAGLPASPFRTDID